MKKVILLGFCLLSFLYSQSTTDIIPFNSSNLGFKFQHASSKYDDGQSALSGVYSLGAKIPLSNNLRLSGTLPFITYKNSQMDGKNAVGNLSVAFDYKKNSLDITGWVISAGVVLPLSAEKDFVALSYGLLADLFNSRNYSPNTLIVTTNFSKSFKPSDNSFVEINFGPEFWFPTKYGEYRDTEVIFNYSLAAGVNADNLLFFTSLRGLVMITADASSSSDRFAHGLTLGMGYNFGKVIPKLDYSVYIEDRYNNFIKGVFSLGVNVIL